MSNRTKEQNYKKENGEVLANCKTNSREFWNKLKMLRTQGRRQNESTINPSEWFDHFEKLLNIPVEIDTGQINLLVRNWKVMINFVIIALKIYQEN